MNKLLTLFLAAVMGSFLSMTAVGEEKSTNGDFEFSKPYKHGNLTIFFVKGKETFKGEIMGLDEAMKQKKLIVHETGNVNKLSVQNNGDVAIYIQAGDIVKGGKQDRVLAVDLVVPPKSGKIAINSFCVEQGRWAKRSGESLQKFNGNAYTINGKGLRNAVKGRVGSQGKVWTHIQAQQSKLSKNIKENVKSGKSATSLQLTLENKKLQEETKKMTAVFEKAKDENKDAIGMVFFVNNKFSSADVYGNKKMFKMMWSKLINASVTEALSEKDEKTAEFPKDWKKNIFGDVKIVKKNELKSPAFNTYEVEEADKILRYNSKLKTKSIHRSWDHKSKDYKKESSNGNFRNGRNFNNNLNPQDQLQQRSR